MDVPLCGLLLQFAVQLQQDVVGVGVELDVTLERGQGLNHFPATLDVLSVDPLIVVQLPEQTLFVLLELLLKLDHQLIRLPLYLRLQPFHVGVHHSTGLISIL